MLKKAAIFVLISLLLLNCTSCGLFTGEALDPEYKDKVVFVSDESGSHHIEYSGYIFLPHSEDILRI